MVNQKIISLVFVFLSAAHLQDVCSGSNKKFARDAVLPYIILPVLLIIASISPAITIAVMVFIGMAALYIHSRPRAKNRSPFFFSWTISSGLTMLLVYELEILTYMEITQLENLTFVILLTCTCYFFYKMKAIAEYELAGTSKGKEYSPVLTANSHYCQICQIEVNDKFFHSIWWDCCILRPNYIHYLVAHTFALATLLYGSNLGLTTVCQPILYHAILVPQNCNNVYDEFLSEALSFVTCVYAMGYAIIIGAILVHQVFCNFIPRTVVEKAGKCPTCMKMKSAE